MQSEHSALHKLGSSIWPATKIIPDRLFQQFQAEIVHVLGTACSFIASAKVWDQCYQSQPTAPHCTNVLKEKQKSNPKKGLLYQDGYHQVGGELHREQGSPVCFIHFPFQCCKVAGTHGEIFHADFPSVNPSAPHWVLPVSPELSSSSEVPMAERDFRSVWAVYSLEQTHDISLKGSFPPHPPIPKQKSVHASVYSLHRSWQRTECLC